MPTTTLETQSEAPVIKRKIVISEALKEVLLKIDDRSYVRQLLLREEVDERLLTHPDKNFNYLDLSSSNKGHISYLTQDKIDKIEAEEDKDYWKPKMRYTARPGSVMKKLFKCDGYDIENFATQFLSLVDPPIFRMEIVKGKDIAKFYNYSNYYQQCGSLGASCMKGSPENYFDIYVENEDVVSMLVMLDQHDKVMGRSILWSVGEEKLLDRIYVCNDMYMNYFYNWAKENKCYYKEHNNWSTPKNIIFNGEKIIKEFEIDLKNVEFGNYPYLDTFKWLNKKEGKIYNYIPKGKLNDLIVISDHMGNYFDSDYFAFCEYSNDLCMSRDMVHLDYLNMNVYRGHTVRSYVLDTYIISSHSTISKEIQDRIFNEEYDRFNDKEKIEKKKIELEEKKKRGDKFKESLNVTFKYDDWDLAVQDNSEENCIIAPNI